MKETSPGKSYIDRLRFWQTSKAHGGNRSGSTRPVHDPNSDSIIGIPISNSRTTSPAPSHHSATGTTGRASTTSINGVPDSDGSHDALDAPSIEPASKAASYDDADANAAKGGPPASTPVQTAGEGPQLETDPQPAGQESENENKNTPSANVIVRFLLACKKVLFHSWFNVLLVFVPVGIAVQFVPNMNPGVIFAMNAIAIVPLAGLLSYSTETVAHRMGDAVGALLNITFGNAVELIIFIIALVKNEVRIVQASLLGSILANLLLILGMSFLLGGLRFREQIYNSTVTQMSACLLSLSVISLVLPTAFHASFKDTDKADRASLQISHGTSVILLLVYGIYLFFQLKSHAYLYESTPQYLIDAESTPGPAVAWFDSASSSDDSSDSDSDSDSSGRSRITISKRVRRVIRASRRRKSSFASVDTADQGPTRTPSFGTANATPINEDGPLGELRMRAAGLSRTSVFEGDESAVEDEKPRRRRRRRHRRSYRRHRKHLKKFQLDSHGANSPAEATIHEGPENAEKTTLDPGEPRRVDFAVVQTPAARADGVGGAVPARRPLDALLGMSLKPVAKSLAPTIFIQSPGEKAMPAVPTGPVPRVRYGIRRTNSLPDRLNGQSRAPGVMFSPHVQLTAVSAAKGRGEKQDENDDDDDLSRTAAILLLLVSTGLVAVCAEFMVSSINGLVASSSVSETFIGLIILPIVGNAAEHVTAITVALKNKMDLAIGVAVGSSIQIALFVTPLMVILGWAMKRDMTLYFTLFETVCLFVSAFIANFLVLDGRSNYLEGALLCATYIIIAVVAFYYPAPEDASAWGS